MRTCGVFLSAAISLLVLFPAKALSQEALQPSQGKFLVASRQIQDPRFRESVILLLGASRDGAAGLIINKPGSKKLSGFFSGIRPKGGKGDRLYYGGPVEPRSLMVLLRTSKTAGDATPLLKGVSVSSSAEVLQNAIRKKRAGDDYRVFSGYAGWAAGQLELELRRGDWHVVAADAATVFHEDEKMVWTKLIRKGEEIMVRDRTKERRVEIALQTMNSRR